MTRIVGIGLFCISPNPFSSQAFTSAFNLDRGKLLEVGYPRVDFLVNADSNKCMELKRRYGLPLDKKLFSMLQLGVMIRLE